MNPKHLVKISNIIGLISIILLIYWVFTFILIEVFGLKVFRENMTETFYLSILGILALMAGALIVNIMFNLTRIAEKHNNDRAVSKTNKRFVLALVFLFPIIGAFLFAGDYLTSKKKEKLLISSAEYIVSSNSEKTEQILNYEFTKEYINQTAEILELYTKTDEHFQTIQIIYKDTLDNAPVYLGIGSYSGISTSDTTRLKKADYIYRTTKPEREYLEMVFTEGAGDLRYSSYNGNYELFYPFIKGEKIIVLYFSDRQRYGKMGS